MLEEKGCIKEPRRQRRDVIRVKVGVNKVAHIEEQVRRQSFDSVVVEAQPIHVLQAVENPHWKVGDGVAPQVSAREQPQKEG